MNYGLYFAEHVTQYETMLREVTGLVAQGRTRFQEYWIYETPAFGKILVLDREIQSAERDEYIYHETLVHPPMLAHPDPRHVLIVGGGEGATLREVLRHPSVERALMVDIDGELIEMARELLPEWHRGAFDDPRSRVVVADARAWLERHDDQFDVIIVDLTDPVGADNPARMLYTVEFYRLLAAHLRPGGIAGVQASTMLPTHYRIHPVVRATLDAAFRHAASYTNFVPSFFVNFSFVTASQEVDPLGIDATLYAERIASRQLDLRHLTPEYLRRLYTLPADIARHIAEDGEVSTDAAPYWVEV